MFPELRVDTMTGQLCLRNPLGKSEPLWLFRVAVQYSVEEPSN